MTSSDDRTVLTLSGGDAEEFLQGLITNDVERARDGLIFAAMLTPQGKYIVDFFVTVTPDAVLIDVAAQHAQALAQRLTMYKLRADVTIDISDVTVSRGVGDVPDGAYADPRHPSLGWRAYSGSPDAGSVDWDALRVEHGVPETGVELVPNESYPLEMGFERLNGVDFKKGCYVGQEVTARMKHKTELRKGLAKVTVEGTAPVGTAITSGGKPVGTLFTQSAGKGLAYLRFDRAGEDMEAGDATVHWQA